ncbi:hypothetical protein [Aliivibrio fischeri]|uniref:PIN domain-containing protein n=1 Tax=Aliivibrio fischeri TaxID=668 RepID=A0A844P7V2_ALIFS|nr:hypothetical protein [Aliivibrio fischeri]MUK51444.1 hypothetical protein [Aliivibrio fischeri]
MKPNPFNDQVYFDSCAFNGGTDEDIEAAGKLIHIFESTNNKIMLSYSVAEEMNHSKAPEDKRHRAEYSIKTVRIPLTDEETSKLKKIEEIMLGKSSSSKRKADCLHVFEAQKYGRYFVSSDDHIYPYAESIFNEFGLYIVRPIELLKIVEYYQSEA